jgi:hypothetical protein
MRQAEPDRRPYYRRPGLPESPNPPDHERSVDLGDGDFTDMVATHPDPSTIQDVHVRRARQLRLRDLAGLPHLRAITIFGGPQPAERVELSIEPSQPVEQVDVTAEHFEPQRLAATTSLRYLRLAGNREPAPISALAQLPNLVRLDLAEAAISDVATVATFPALRVLILNIVQWRQLLATGWKPERLAAAKLGGSCGAAPAATWRTALLGANRPGAHHHMVRGPR